MTEDRKTLEAIRDEVFAARTKDGRRVPQPWHRLHELTGGIFFRREIMGDDKNSLETRETFYHLLRFSSSQAHMRVLAHRLACIQGDPTTNERPRYCVVLDEPCLTIIDDRDQVCPADLPGESLWLHLVPIAASSALESA